MSADRWRPGMPLTEDQKQRRRDTIARNKNSGGGGKTKAKPRGGTPVPPRARVDGPAPRRPVAGVSAKIVGQIEELVGQALGIVEGGIIWGARRMTVDEVREVEVQSAKEPGKTEIALEPTGRKFRAVSDETIAADKLEEWERDELAIALTAEMLRYPRLRAFLVKLIELQERTTLPMILTLIALPRMIRHGYMPQEFEQFIEAARETARAKHDQGRRRPRAIEEPPAVPPPAPATPEADPPPARAAAANGKGEKLPTVEELEEQVPSGSRVAPVAP